MIDDWQPPPRRDAAASCSQWLPNRSKEAQLVAPLGQAGHQSACTQAVSTARVLATWCCLQQRPHHPTPLAACSAAAARRQCPPNRRLCSPSLIRADARPWQAAAWLKQWRMGVDDRKGGQMSQVQGIWSSKQHHARVSRSQMGACSQTTSTTRQTGSSNSVHSPMHTSHVHFVVTCAGDTSNTSGGGQPRRAVRTALLQARHDCHANVDDQRSSKPASKWGQWGGQ